MSRGTWQIMHVNNYERENVLTNIYPSAAAQQGKRICQNSLQPNLRTLENVRAKLVSYVTGKGFRKVSISVLILPGFIFAMAHSTSVINNRAGLKAFFSYPPFWWYIIACLNAYLGKYSKEIIHLHWSQLPRSTKGNGEVLLSCSHLMIPDICSMLIELLEMKKRLVAVGPA